MAATLVQPKTAESETYTYSSQPKVAQQRKPYRPTYGNIMHDRRIIRGNTYALQTLPAAAQPNPLEIQRRQEAKRRLLAQKRAKELVRIRSPDPVEGRKHIDVQTELYLEEITDRVEEADVQTQTDWFLDRPATPLFVPAKTGMDASTQILEGELFDFDLEVKPILEVLVGKTVEQALLEVMEEEELENLRAQQRIFEENRNAERVETQRLEEQERRYREEKERRMQQQREALLKEKETAEKIAARAFAQSYLADLVPSVFGNLNEQGFFFDPVERQIDSSIVPWLLDAAEEVLCKKTVARIVLDAIIRDVVARKTIQLSAEDVTVTKVASSSIPNETSANSSLPSSSAEATIETQLQPSVPEEGQMPQTLPVVHTGDKHDVQPPELLISQSEDEHNADGNVLSYDQKSPSKDLDTSQNNDDGTLDDTQDDNIDNSTEDVN